MASKAAKVVITGDLLEMILGLEGKNISVKKAQMNYNYFNKLQLELILEGEGLSEEFEVEEGRLIRMGIVNITRNQYKEIVKAWVTPA